MKQEGEVDSLDGTDEKFEIVPFEGLDWEQGVDLSFYKLLILDSCIVKELEDEEEVVSINTLGLLILKLKHSLDKHLVYSRLQTLHCGFTLSDRVVPWWGDF